MPSTPKNPIGAHSPFARGSGPSIESLPVKSRPFPESARATTMGGILGRAPVTPGILSGRAVPSFSVTTMTLPVNVWTPIDVERSSLLFSLDTDTDEAGPVYFYAYGRIPSRTTPALTAETQVSERGGVCLLSNPGRWFVYNFGGANPIARTVQVIDADNPQVADRLLRRSGVNYINESNVTLNDPTITYQVAVGPSVWREAITIQNVPTLAGASAPVRLSLDKPSAYLVTAGAWTGVGFRLLVNGTITLSAKALARGNIFACLEAAGVAQLEWAEFRDA